MNHIKTPISLLLLGFLFASCAPYPPDPPFEGPVPNANKVEPPATTPKTPEQIAKEKARIKANKEAAERRAKLRELEKKNEQNDPQRNVTPPRGDGGSTVTPPTPPKKQYKTAVPIPGKPGFVYNPWTNTAVDVRAIPSGSLVRDPNDGNPNHKFRVP